MTVTTSTAPPSTTQGVDAQAATGSGEQPRPASSGQAVMQGQPASSEQTVMQGQPASAKRRRPTAVAQPVSGEITASKRQRKTKKMNDFLCKSE